MSILFLKWAILICIAAAFLGGAALAIIWVRHSRRPSPRGFDILPDPEKPPRP